MIREIVTVVVLCGIELAESFGMVHVTDPRVMTFIGLAAAATAYMQGRRDGARARVEVRP